MSRPSPPDDPSTRLASQLHGLPRLFIDRSLGRLELPQILRAHGLELITLAEHYGIPADENVEDETWIRDSAQLGWVALMKDQRIRFRRAEKDAIRRHGARCFCLPRGDLTSSQAAVRYLDNLAAIVHACQMPGPFLYAVHAGRIVEMSLEG